ncbi:unnamed protein product [Caenorhabditis angaria]|uniref:Uncharacterized protein n=1 Tax=Caenorhabditis angaria TaxID=860376 RepID=A0A9P1MUZ4_9PELO|nr:unnamed protein product [Caenorhabditis angaria]
MLKFLLILVPIFLAQDLPKAPNIYKWLEQNSYICDPSLTNKRNPKFLTLFESHRIKCSCGDPLKSKAACARKSTRDKPHCVRLPDTCMKEYTVIFANAGNRMKNSKIPIKNLTRKNHRSKINHHKALKNQKGEKEVAENIFDSTDFH